MLYEMKVKFLRVTNISSIIINHDPIYILQTYIKVIKVVDK